MPFLAPKDHVIAAALGAAAPEVQWFVQSERYRELRFYVARPLGGKQFLPEDALLLARKAWKPVADEYKLKRDLGHGWTSNRMLCVAIPCVDGRYSGISGTGKEYTGSMFVQQA